MFPNLIAVQVDGLNFRPFSELHEFDKPNDLNALDLMNSCAEALLDEYPDIVFSFVFKKTSKFYQRRASKMLSLVASFFTSLYVTKWKEFSLKRS